MDQNRFIEILKSTHDIFDVLSKLFSDMIPSTGPAPTVAGEIIRAMSRIGYRFLNDGDRYYEGYGLETVAPSMQYLVDFVDEYGDKGEKDRVNGFIESTHVDAADWDNNEYKNNILDIFDIILEILSKSEYASLFTEPNDDDSRRVSAKWFVLNQPLYDVEFPIEDSTIIELLDSEIIDEDIVTTYVHDALNTEFGFLRDSEIDVVCVDDAWLTVSNLHYDEKDVVENWGKSDTFWDSLKDEYSDSLTESPEKRVMREYKERCNRCKADYNKFNLEGSQLREDLTEDDLDDDAATRCCFKYNCGRSQLVQMLKDAD